MSSPAFPGMRADGVVKLAGAGLLAASLIAGCGSAGGSQPLSPAQSAAPGSSAGTPPTAEQPSPDAPPTNQLPSIAADDGARIVSAQLVSDRIVDVEIESPAMGRRAMARLVLPVGYATDPQRRWPVIYLLHGAGDPESYRSWTQTMAIDRLPSAAGAILVSPEGGNMGYYSDWFNAGAGGPPRWETFHLTELRQLLARNWRSSDRMAVVGISMGGFGAISYAGRHPGMFVAAASLSGVLDTTSVASWFSPALWGDPADQADVWAAHNPIALVPKLAGTAVLVAYGDGLPGPLDSAGAGSDDLERLIARMNESFVARMKGLRLPITVDAYGPGSHTAPYWRRELDRALPFLMDALAG